MASVAAFKRLARFRPGRVVIEQLLRDLRNNGKRVRAAALSLGRPLIARAVDAKLAKRVVLASIVEDSPSRANRVWSESAGACLSYSVSAPDQARLSEVRGRLATLLAPFKPVLLGRAGNNAMLAHACGTCRMGYDEASSVVDEHCKLHDLDNVFVVDSSVFPTSGGINPALTIAANALRVADRLSGMDRSAQRAVLRR